MDTFWLQRFLPLLILAFSFLFTAVFANVFLISLPLCVVCLHWYYPGSGSIQIAFSIFWLVLLAGNGRATAFSADNVKKPLAIHLLQIAAGLGSAAAILFRAGTWNASSSVALFKAFVYFIMLSAVMTFVAAYLVTYAVAPLIVLDTTEVFTPLQSYHAECTGTHRHREWHYSIRFENDPDLYVVNWLWFRRFRNKIGLPFSYVKCRCLFGLVYIKTIAQDADRSGEQPESNHLAQLPERHS